MSSPLDHKALHLELITIARGDYDTALKALTAARTKLHAAVTKAVQADCGISRKELMEASGWSEAQMDNVRSTVLRMSKTATEG